MEAQLLSICQYYKIFRKQDFKNLNTTKMVSWQFIRQKMGNIGINCVLQKGFLSKQTIFCRIVVIWTNKMLRNKSMSILLSGGNLYCRQIFHLIGDLFWHTLKAILLWCLWSHWGDWLNSTISAYFFSHRAFTFFFLGREVIMCVSLCLNREKVWRQNLFFWV